MAPSGHAVGVPWSVREAKADTRRQIFSHFIAHLIIIAIFVTFPYIILWLLSRM
jgi:hypothetical protein